MDGVANTNVNNVTNIYNYGADGAGTPDLSGMSLEEALKVITDMANAPGGPGMEAVANAFGNQSGTIVADILKDQIDGNDDIPQAKKDDINETIDATLAANNLDTREEAEALIDMIKDMQKDAITEEIEETVEGIAGGGAGEKADGKGDAGGAMNWLVALAKAMSKIAGKHLEQMIAKQEELGRLEEKHGEINAAHEKSKPTRNEGESDEAFDKRVSDHAATGSSNLGGQAAEMTQLTAEIQAHTQMFKMMQETMTTVIKSVGEALNTAIRKQ